MAVFFGMAKIVRPESSPTLITTEPIDKGHAYPQYAHVVRERIFHLRLTEAEFAVLKKVSRERGRNMSQHLREMIRKDVPKKPNGASK